MGRPPERLEDGTVPSTATGEAPGSSKALPGVQNESMASEKVLEEMLLEAQQKTVRSERAARDHALTKFPEVQASVPLLHLVHRPPFRAALQSVQDIELVGTKQQKRPNMPPKRQQKKGSSQASRNASKAASKVPSRQDTPVPGTPNNEANQPKYEGQTVVGIDFGQTASSIAVINKVGTIPPTFKRCDRS